jgi:hypothetical protein
MRTNTAIVLAWALLLAVFASGCGTGNAEADDTGDRDQARLEIKGSPGENFSGSCTIGNEEPRQIGGDVPKSITYNLKGRSLDCEIGSNGDLQVELTVGENTHSAQSISGGTLNLTYEDGSISTATSSASRSSGGTSSTSQVTSSQRTSTQRANGKTNKPAKLTQESRNVSGFDAVELRGVGNLSIEQTGSESLTVEAEEDVIPKLTTRVVNNRLIIGPESNTIHTTGPINYKLTLKDLRSLEVMGSANIEAQGLRTDRLAVTISGAGNVRMDGKADQQEINILGSGTYQAEDLQSKEVKINVAGSGSAIVNVSEQLDVGISGVGSVEYIGHPAVKQNVSGTGRVSKH